LDTPCAPVQFSQWRAEDALTEMGIKPGYDRKVTIAVVHHTDAVVYNEAEAG
jgi:hypothetical protein